MPGKASSPATFLAFVGLIPAYDLKQMEDLIQADSERIEDEPKRGSESKDVA